LTQNLVCLMAGAAAGAGEFKWPTHYSFPPFFSKQPNLETNAMRVQMWKDLILNYCRHHRVFVLNVREAVATSPLFGNEAISRRLQPADANDIFHLMASAGLAEWYSSGATHRRCCEARTRSRGSGAGRGGVAWGERG
jgi:ESCRT-II complex subunit VPS25